MTYSKLSPFCSRIFCLLLLLLSLPGYGQVVVGKIELEDFEYEDRLFPLRDLDRSGSETYLEHETVSLLSPGSFVQLWMPDWRSGRRRMLTRYNLLLEVDWTVEFELNWEESILKMYPTETELCVLTYEYESIHDRHMIKMRSFHLDNGTPAQSRIFYQYPGRLDQEVFFDFSPTEQLFALYYFSRPNDRRVSVYSDYVDREGMLGSKIIRAEYVHYRVFDLALDTVVTGSYPLADKKTTWMSGQVDEEGNFYLIGAQKPTFLSVYCFDRTTKTSQLLTYGNFSDYRELNEPYTTHFPPTVGAGKKLYLAYANRQLKGRLRGTKAFQVICFDFARDEIDLRRNVEVTSTLLVSVEKQRERFGLPPLRRFDGFMIREIIEMPDQSVWLWVQKYDKNPHGTTNISTGYPVDYEHEIEESLLFGFDASGTIQQALIVPSAQRNKTRFEKAGDFYSRYLNKETGLMTLLTREPSGDKLAGPERLYYRTINLKTSEISNRNLLYEGERRNQYLLMPYTVWHNNHLVTFVLLDGELGDPWLITINIEGEAVEEEAGKKKGKG